MSDIDVRIYKNKRNGQIILIPKKKIFLKMFKKEIPRLARIKLEDWSDD